MVQHMELEQLTARHLVLPLLPCPPLLPPSRAIFLIDHAPSPRAQALEEVLNTEAQMQEAREDMDEDDADLIANKRKKGAAAAAAGAAGGEAGGGGVSTSVPQNMVSS